MLTATPVRNPIITEWDTKRVYRPSRRTPASTITPPAIAVRSTRASARSAGDTSVSADPAASAAAVVVVTTIIRVLLVSPPATRPAKLA